ncbi:hypothetical protein E3O19_05035 [Cryobacterium algoritolerans]|uniref:Mutator family transposase n=1 Tax=Cryobacterium algoritolerans TaxID=1259184 RepID=A0A4V3IFC2_9MICO|nr:hypothetical protein E3O19_05035 [Cryobacterium algoritolerans]
MTGRPPRLIRSSARSPSARSCTSISRRRARDQPLGTRARSDRPAHPAGSPHPCRGVSTRKVEIQVKALGADTGISKSEVSRICADLEGEVAAFRDRDFGETGYPYVFLDATYCKARVNHRVISQAMVVAIGVAARHRVPRRELAALPGAPDA